MTKEDPFFDAYRQTRYCADTPHGRIEIRVEQSCPTLDTLLREAGCATWAYITAFNPGSVPLSGAENDSRQHELEEAIRQLRHPMCPGEGISDDGTWPAEQSILVLGIGRQIAVRLGHRFGQRAIICGELGGEAVLVRCE